jgi:hypothetical protein
MKPLLIRRFRHFGLAPVIVLSLAAGCSDSAQHIEAQAADNTATRATIQESRSAPATTPGKNNGVVRSVETAGAYTYIKVDIDGEEFWLATMVTVVQPGQKIVWRDYAMMRNFKSKALGREFAQILFVDQVFDEHYSFIRVNQNGSSIWLAAPETTIRVGQSVRWSGGAPMRNFTSRSLNRSFDEILFVGAVHSS